MTYDTPATTLLEVTVQGSAATAWPTVTVDGIEMGGAAGQLTVQAVLARAADLLGEQRWVHRRTYRSSDPRLTALQAITLAVDELFGTGPGSVDAHTAALDAVCLHVFARRHGTKRCRPTLPRRRTTPGDPNSPNPSWTSAANG